MEATTSLPTFPEDQPSLGWAIADWIEGYLLQPDGDTAGEPFALTEEQLRFLLWLYAVDADGRFVYRRAILRRAKGWGKSPFLGALALAELCGPVRFSHWATDSFGIRTPVGAPHPMPWVVIAGVSQTQTENTFAAIRAMSEESALVDDFGLDVGMTRILIPNGGKIVPVTASASTQEGARPTFAIMDETHHWTKSNGGHALARVIRRNLAKVNGRLVETTNAHEPGHDSTAEKSYLSWRSIVEGRSRAKGILYDSREAPADLYAFWGRRISDYLNKRAAADRTPVVINLASQEYFRAVDVKALKARVVECVFEEWKPAANGRGGQYKVISFFAKRARGLMARWAVLNQAVTPQALERFDLEGYAFDAAASRPDRMVFRRKSP